MSSEMIERVARALAKLGRYDPDGDPNHISETMMTDVAWPPEARLWWRYIQPARAAIEAMRAATESMYAAGAHALLSPDVDWQSEGPEGDKAAIDDMWRAMIDAALSKPVGGG